MILRYLIPMLVFLCSCRQNVVFLDQFQDQGELALECVRELGGNSIVHMNSMVKSGDCVVWNKYNTGKGITLYVYHIPSDSLIEFLMPLKDSAYTHCYERLYEYNDSVVMSFNEVYQYFSYVHLADTIYISNYQNLNIRNEEFFNWRGRAVLRSVYPGKDSLFLVGLIKTDRADYGVYDCNSQFLYPSYSCIPPTFSDMKCLLPDYKDHITVVRQKDSNRYAVFRSYYQLYDIIDINGTALQLVKRSIYHHSQLTWEDQHNLQQDLSCQFFPGFFAQSSQYIITLYQSEEKKQYLLLLDWEGKPRYSYRFPDEFEVYGLCRNQDNFLYVAGKMKQGRTGLFQMKY